MTVEQIIINLSKYPKDMEVIYNNRVKILDYIKSANSKRFKIMTATVKDESPLKDETYKVSVRGIGFPDNTIKCTHSGHHYEITNLVSSSNGTLTPTDNTTTLNFFLKDQETGKIQDGVMNEQVFAILLDRIYKLNDKFHCVENELMISHLESCIKLCDLVAVLYGNYV